MTRKFESHITMPREQSALVEASAAVLGMTFSAIDGDPVMGKQAYCYLTAYDTNGERLLESVRSASLVLAQRGVTVLREKVEEILYDSKTGHDAMERCCECSLPDFIGRIGAPLTWRCLQCGQHPSAADCIHVRLVPYV